jgi:hypothetical protein
MKVFNKKGLSALAAVAILAAACGGSTASTTGKTLTIGITLPLNGSSLASAGPARDGALLAIKEASVEGYTLKVKVLDHAIEGSHNPARHDSLVAEKAREISGCDAIVLAQFTLSRAVPAVSGVSPLPIFNSPGAAVAKMRRLLDR